MARLFDDATTQYLEYAGAVLTAEPVSIACWFNADADPAVAFEVACIMTSAGSSRLGLQLLGSGLGGAVRAVTVDGAGSGVAAAATSATWAAGTLSHGCAVFASSSSRAAYLNGANKGTEATSISVAGLNRTSIGSNIFSGLRGFYFSGVLAEVGIWNVALTDADVAALAAGFSPKMVRPEALVAYWPLYGRTSPETDPRSGREMTVSGATQTDHPRILYPRGAQSRRFGAGAGLAAPIVAYSPTTRTITKNAPVSIAAPTNTGGAIASYSEEGSLPTGLTLDTVTGIISGTPTVVESQAGVTRATNATGSSDAPLTINVVASGGGSSAFQGSAFQQSAFQQSAFQSSAFG